MALIYGAQVAFKMRKIPDIYNESKVIAFMLWNILFCVFVALPASYLTMDSTMLYFFKFGAMAWALNTSTLGLILNKLYLIHFNNGNNTISPHGFSETQSGAVRFVLCSRVFVYFTFMEKSLW